MRRLWRPLALPGTIAESNSTGNKTSKAVILRDFSDNGWLIISDQILRDADEAEGSAISTLGIRLADAAFSIISSPMGGA